MSRFIECPNCGNGMFDQGLDTVWCGACGTRAHRAAWRCPTCSDDIRHCPTARREDDVPDMPPFEDDEFDEEL